MKASVAAYLHFWLFLGLNPFLKEMGHTSWYFTEPLRKHFCSSKLYNSIKLWVYVFHHLWNFLHVFYCQRNSKRIWMEKIFHCRNSGDIFPKEKKCSLVIFLKNRFWPTKIGLEAYGNLFLHCGMDYLNSTRGEAMRALFNSFVACIQAVPGSGSWLVWAVNPPNSFHTLHWEGCQEIEDLNTDPDPNSCRFVPTFLHHCLVLIYLLNVFSELLHYNKIKCLFFSVSNTLTSVYKSYVASQASKTLQVRMSSWSVILKDEFLKNE